MIFIEEKKQAEEVYFLTLFTSPKSANRFECESEITRLEVDQVEAVWPLKLPRNSNNKTEV